LSTLYFYSAGVQPICWNRPRGIRGVWSRWGQTRCHCWRHWPEQGRFSKFCFSLK